MNDVLLSKYKSHSFFRSNAQISFTQFDQLISLLCLQAYGQTFIEDDKFLALVGSFSSVFNALGRVFWGHMMDRTSFKV